jgi:CheY-like chemotaxis protein
MEGQSKGKILWVDDEIDFLRSHILFLEERGYDVTAVTNADDALQLLREQQFDLVLLDEMMSGKDGLAALAEIKEMNPSLPVVMVTKNEEESLMEEAIGSKIDDYLTKPVNPSQVLSTCKKFLERQKISGARLSRDYASQFQQISVQIMGDIGWREWLEIYLKLVNWEFEVERHPDLGLKQVLEDLKHTCNIEFARFVEKHYPRWIHQLEDAPPLSVDVVRQFVVPHLREGTRVVFIVIDNMRMDQWQAIEPLLFPYFHISKDYYFSILPTATPFARNAIFSGLYPSEIEQKYPDLWQKGGEDDFSRNRYEHQLLNYQLKSLNVPLKPEARYVKILESGEGRNLEKNLASYLQAPLLAVVINIVDIFAHNRSTSDILKEIVPDEGAFRSLTRSWFEHSFLFRVLRSLAQEDVTVILTSDHGSVRCMHGTKVIGDRDTSTNLRYKFGKNIKCDSKHAIFVKNPRDYKLPSRGINVNYIIAKEDYYFVYPTNYHKYLNYYKDSFQHGGVSMEEMILPVIQLTPK